MTAAELITRLPSPGELRRRCQALAMLNRIGNSGSGLPIDGGAQFAARWRDSSSLATWSSCDGDEWAIVFDDAGAVIRGYHHASPMNSADLGNHTIWPGLLDDLPDRFRPYLADPDVDAGAQYPDDLDASGITVCVWWLDSALRWSASEFDDNGLDDGADKLFGRLIDWCPTAVTDAHNTWFEASAPREPVEAVMQLQPLSPALAEALNPSADFDSLTDSADEIGYPIVD